jgi:flagellar hook-basal body complex protein FliE
MDVRMTTGLLQSLQGAAQSGSPLAPKGAVAGASFANALGDALKSVSQTQQQSSALQNQFQAGAEGVGIEETMLAMQKSQIGFQAALAVRNRLVSAYTDIMNMSV